MTAPVHAVAPPTEVSTRSLTLRPLTGADLESAGLATWHTDPEGYRLMREEPYADAAAFCEVGRRWVSGWADGGPSYWLALDRETHEPVGIGGVRQLDLDGEPYANLYYRLAPDARGRGLAQEIATAAVAYSREWWPQLPVFARIAESNQPSLRIAARAGLRRLGVWFAPGDDEAGPAPVLFQTPDPRVGPPEDDDAVEQLVSLWCAVNEAGGAVGFVGAAPREAVAAALDRHLAQVEAGESTLVRLVEPTGLPGAPGPQGALLGFGFVRRYSGVAAHRATLERVMVDPKQRHRGLGRVLLADLHAVARRGGVELLTIGYRGGTGLGRFYGQAGYVEVGRLPGGLRLREENGTRDVDDVEMAYRLDGRPVHSDSDA